MELQDTESVPLYVQLSFSQNRNRYFILTCSVVKTAAWACIEFLRNHSRNACFCNGNVTTAISACIEFLRHTQTMENDHEQQKVSTAVSACIEFLPWIDGDIDLAELRKSQQPFRLVLSFYRPAAIAKRPPRKVTTAVSACIEFLLLSNKRKLPRSLLMSQQPLGLALSFYCTSLIANRTFPKPVSTAAWACIEFLRLHIIKKIGNCLNRLNSRLGLH